MMKPPSRAPAYLMLYPGLAEIARKHGYSLAVHGSVMTDLDLVAIPWVDDCSDAETLVEALRAHCGWCIDTPGCDDGSTEKPHGRRAWMLYMEFGAQVDLSVMPRVTLSPIVTDASSAGARDWKPMAGTSQWPPIDEADKPA